MYELDIQKNYQWVKFKEDEDINEIDYAIFMLTQLRPGKCMRVLKDDNVLILLNGSEHQYNYWKTNYIDRPHIDAFQKKKK